MNSNIFKINNKVVVITGGAGLMGTSHSEVVIENGGIPVILDISEKALKNQRSKLKKKYGKDILCIKCDITNEEDVIKALSKVLNKYAHIDVLINNAANNPAVSKFGDKGEWSRLENFPLDTWTDDIHVSLTGSFLMCKHFGSEMAKNDEGGVILNISSDLGIFAPDQRLYKKEGLSDDEQQVKPITYSVVKHGLIGLTKYLASYWMGGKVRVNAICPGGIYVDQPDSFVKKFSELVPVGRMAKKDEYKGVVIFLISSASSYITGTTVIIDGGRSAY